MNWRRKMYVSNQNKLARLTQEHAVMHQEALQEREARQTAEALTSLYKLEEEAIEAQRKEDRKAAEALVAREREEKEQTKQKLESTEQKLESAEQRADNIIKKILYKKVNKKRTILEGLPSPKLAETLQSFCMIVSTDHSESVEKVERLLHQVLSECFMLLEARLLQGTSMIASSSSVGNLGLFAAPSREEANSEQPPSFDKRT